MNISFVIPNYNGKKLLEKNLPKVLAAANSYKNGKVEVIVTDDASKDDSLAFLDDFSKKINDSFLFRVIKSKGTKNTGFSSNVNRGVKSASGDIVVLLNSDVIPYKNFLDPLLAHFSNSQVFAVGCLDESIEDEKVVLRGRGRGKWQRGFLQHSAGKISPENTDTLWVSGGSGAFRKSMWDTIGGLNELFSPFYWEDIDLSYRAQKQGYAVLFEPKSKVIHEHEKGVIKSEFKPYNVEKIVVRNQFFFVWLNITDTNLLVNHLIWLPYHLLSAIKNGNKAFLVGFFLALCKLLKVLQRRKIIQKKYIVSDKEILERFQNE